MRGAAEPVRRPVRTALVSPGLRFFETPLCRYVGGGAGPAERAQHAGGGGPTPGHRRRMSARRKQDAVLRLLRGEDLELVSRELAVTAAELSGWREAFLAAGEACLKSRPADARDDEIGRLKEKVGDLTMANELLEAKWCIREEGGGFRGCGLQR